MNAMPPRAISARFDCITLIVHAAVRRVSFQVESLHMDETVAKHIHDRLTLLQHDIADTDAAILPIETTSNE